MGIVEQKTPEAVGKGKERDTKEPGEWRFPATRQLSAYLERRPEGKMLLSAG